MRISQENIIKSTGSYWVTWYKDKQWIQQKLIRFQ